MWQHHGMRVVQDRRILHPGLAVPIAALPKIMRPTGVSMIRGLNLPVPKFYARYDGDKDLWLSDGTIRSPNADGGSNLTSAGRFGQSLVVTSSAANTFNYLNTGFPVDPGTVLFWGRIPDSPTTTIVGVLEVGSSANANRLGLDLLTDPLEFATRFSYWSSGGVIQAQFSGGGIIAVAKQFMFGAYRWSGTSLAIWNNLKKTTDTSTSVLRNGNSGSTFAVGCGGFSANRNWNSNGIDELAIFDVALSDEQIILFYELGQAIRSNLVGS